MIRVVLNFEQRSFFSQYIVVNAEVHIWGKWLVYITRSTQLYITKSQETGEG